MNILADEDIPYLDELFRPYADNLIKISGRAITPKYVKDQDVLLIRSITRVNAELLSNSRVQFVGSMSAGSDHITYNKITIATAPGCNATAVADYVARCLQTLSCTRGRAGVIGVGRVGSLVVQQLQNQGFDVLLSDPPRELLTPLSAFKDLDVICLHTPLTRDGLYPTYHLIDADFLKRQKPDCILISAGRGAVVDFAALKQHGLHLRLCLDVWENEPHIDHEVLKLATLATPHIAGHTLEAKWRASLMIYEKFIAHFSLPPLSQLPPKPIVAHSTFNLLRETERMKNTVLTPAAFDRLRLTIPAR